MLRALALLFTCQLAGEVVVRGLKAPVPGPVLGLVLLAFGLALARRFGGPSSDAVEATALGRVAAGLLGVLGVLFVPAGVGLVQHLPLLREHGLALMAALVGSTLITLVSTVWVFVLVSRLVERGRRA
jgi:holin-like protein